MVRSDTHKIFTNFQTEVFDKAFSFQVRFSCFSLRAIHAQTEQDKQR